MAKIMYEKITIDLVNTLPSRIQDIVTQRFGLKGKSPQTLESIGSRHNITRERVRQIVEEGLRLIRQDAFKGKQRAGTTEAFDLFSKTLKQAGSLKREDLLLDLLQIRDAANHAIFLLTLGDQFHNQRETQEFHPFWSLKREFVDQAPSLHQDLLRFFEQKKSPLAENDLAKAYGRRLFPYLEVSKRIMQGYDGRWGLRHWPEVNPKGMRDKAYLALQDAGKPLHFREVAERVAQLQEKLDLRRKKMVLPQTVHNELIKDPRFVLVGRGTYGLKDWGLETGTVKDVLRAILRGNGGAMSKEEILSHIGSRRQVKASTVTLNLQDKRYFSRNENGTYSVKL